MKPNAQELFSLREKNVVLTGGAGLYGVPMAEALLSAGARLFLGSTNRERLEGVAASLRQRGGDVNALHLDLESEASILAFAEEVYSRAGRVDVLVNNAVARPMASFDAPAADFDRSMRVNATGTFLLSRAIGNRMAGQGGGNIVNIASIQGMVGPEPALYQGLGINSLIPDYFVHKGGLLQLTRFLASYYGGAGVRCNALSPGGLMTDDMPREFVARYTAKTMLGRMAGPEDIKGPLLFLASDASRYMTGVNLAVDGGYTAK